MGGGEQPLRPKRTGAASPKGRDVQPYTQKTEAASCAKAVNRNMVGLAIV